MLQSYFYFLNKNYHHRHILNKNYIYIYEIYHNVLKIDSSILKKSISSI